MTILAIAFIQRPPSIAVNAESPTQLNKSEAQESAKAETTSAVAIEPQGEAKASEPLPRARTVAADTPTSAETCDDAIDLVWPANLRDNAKLVSFKESSMITDRVGPLKADGTVGYNYDGSRDYGCFQINDTAHPEFFAGGDWRDPIYNAQYALKIYNERNNWTAWYAVRGILW